jgi:hypothetical protein
VGPAPADRAVSLAILGIVVSLILAIFAAVDAPTWTILASGLATIVLIVAIYTIDPQTIATHRDEWIKEWTDITVQ